MYYLPSSSDVETHIFVVVLGIHEKRVVFSHTQERKGHCTTHAFTNYQTEANHRGLVIILLPPTVKFSSPVLRVVWAAPPTLLIDLKISPCRWLAHCGLVMCMHPLVRYPESILTTSRSR